MERKRLVRIIPIEGAAPIEIYEFDFSEKNLREFFSYRPANSELTEMEWAFGAATLGIANQWANDFWQWLMSNKRPLWETKHLLSWCLGRIGEEAERSEGEDFEKKAAFVLQRKEFLLGDLGFFGEWFREARLDPKYIRTILHAFLND